MWLKIKSAFFKRKMQKKKRGNTFFSNIEFPLLKSARRRMNKCEWVFPFVSIFQAFSTQRIRTHIHSCDPCGSVLVRLHSLLNCIAPNVKSPKFVGKHFQVKVVSIQTVNDSHFAFEDNVFHFDILFVWFDYVDCSDHRKPDAENWKPFTWTFSMPDRIEIECIHFSSKRNVFLFSCYFVVGIGCSLFVGCVINRIQLENCVIVDWWWAFYSRNCFILFSMSGNAGITQYQQIHWFSAFLLIQF